MMRLLQLLFIGHFHKWKTARVVELTYEDGKTRGSRWIQECETCGKVTNRDLI